MNLSHTRQRTREPQETPTLQHMYRLCVAEGSPPDKMTITRLEELIGDLREQRVNHHGGRNLTVKRRSYCSSICQHVSVLKPTYARTDRPHRFVFKTPALLVTHDVLQNGPIEKNPRLRRSLLGWHQTCSKSSSRSGRWSSDTTEATHGSEQARSAPKATVASFASTSP